MIAEDRLNLPLSVRKFHHIQMNGKKLSSVSEGILAGVPYVIAKPVFPFSAVDTTTSDVRPAQIQYFIKHSLSVVSTSPHLVHTFLL